MIENIDYNKVQQLMKDTFDPEHKPQDIWFHTKCSCGFEIISKDKNKIKCPKCQKILIWEIQNNA